MSVGHEKRSGVVAVSPTTPASGAAIFRWAAAFALSPVVLFQAAQAQGADPEEPAGGLDDIYPDADYTGDASAAPIMVRYNSIPATAIGIPEGFEELDGPVETLFDLRFQDRRIGVFPGRLENGRFTFLDPEGVVQSLPGVHPDLLRNLIERPLAANENRACLPGQELDCGVLPSGSTGLIVSAEAFRVDLFLGREYLSQGTPRQYLMIGDPVSGPSVIQNIAASISASRVENTLTPDGDNVRFGVVAETIASAGRTSAVSRLIADDYRGVEAREAYVQHFFDDTRIAAGLIQSNGTASLTGFGFYGAEVSSFSGRATNLAEDSSIPIDVVLPRAARVEIFRDGILLSALQYEAGLQSLDTSRLPAGSYPIRIIATDASGVVLDEVRTFTRSLDMPPRGETVYAVRAGVRALDNLTSIEQDMQASGLFPETTSETIISASASRRISDAASATLALTAIGGDLFPEAELQWYRGLFKTSAALAVGPEGQYAASAAVNFQIGDVTGSLSARKTSGADLDRPDFYDPRAYRPFLQSEENVFASLQTRLYGGSLGFRASLSRSELSEERYTVGLNYGRSLGKTFFGNGFVSAEAVTTDSETRIGIRFSVQSRPGGRGATLNTMAGGDIFYPSSDRIEREGFFPAARMTYSRAGQLGDGSYSTSVSAGTAGGDSNATVNAGAGTGLGAFDGSLGVSKLRGSPATETFVTGNALTGFVIGGGQFKFGSAGYGDAAILLNIESENQDTAQGGRYRILLDNQQSDIVRVGGTASQLVPAFTRTLVGLVPVDAPAFDIDLTPQEVPLYPGNVVRLAWKAVYVTAAFGRLLDHEDIPVANALVRSENGDQSITGDQGYFSITAPLGSPVTIRRADGSECATLHIDDLGREQKGRPILRLGNVHCQQPPDSGPPSQRAEDPAPLAPVRDDGRLKLRQAAWGLDR